MRIELDDVVCTGEVAVAAVVKRWLHARRCLHAVSIHGAKHPVAILIRRDHLTMAFELDGSRINLFDFEQRYPGLRAGFERRAICASQTPLAP